MIAVLAGIGLAVDAVDRLPFRTDAVEGGEAMLVGLTGEDDALELGVGEQAVGNDLHRQLRTV